MTNEERREKNRLKAQKWRARNPEKSRESSRRWREANPEKFKESVRKWQEKNREWYAEHAEEQKARAREWREKNAERKRETDAAWREAHRDEIRKYSRDRYYLLKGVSPEAWRAEFARRWGELADRLGAEGLLLRLAALMRKGRRR